MNKPQMLGLCNKAIHEQTQVLYIGDPLWGLSTQHTENTFHYTHRKRGQITKYSKKIIYEHIFFVADGIEKSFAERMALQLINQKTLR